MKVNPKDLWANDKTYSELDERGIPTHKYEEQKVKEDQVQKKITVSKAINDKLRKKLEKEWNEQNEAYNKWL